MRQNVPKDLSSLGINPKSLADNITNFDSGTRSIQDRLTEELKLKDLGINSNSLIGIDEVINFMEKYNLELSRKGDTELSLNDIKKINPIRNEISDKYREIIEEIFGEKFKSFDVFRAHPSRIYWSQDSKLLAQSSVLENGKVVFWAIDASEGEWLLNEEKKCNISSKFNIFELAWSTNNKIFAAALSNHTIHLWDIGNNQSSCQLRGHSARIWDLAWSSNNLYLASASEDNTIRIWNTKTGELRQIYGHSINVICLEWSPDGEILAFGSTDKKIYIRNIKSRKTTNILEGHLKGISALSFSADGQFLASQSLDGDVRIWRCDVWVTVAVIAPRLSFVGTEEGWKNKHPLVALKDVVNDSEQQEKLAHRHIGIDFHPTELSIAMWNREENIIQIWDLDPDILLRSKIDNKTLYIKSAKVMLVGESGRGKSCLACRLAEDRYEEMPTTHGMWIWHLQPEQLFSKATTTEVTPEEGQQNIVLWDMGGQYEYRLVHKLFLKNTNLAIFCFDPTQGRTEFKEVEAWDRELKKEFDDSKTVKLLVGTKLDKDKDNLRRLINLSDIEELRKRLKFKEYYPTSAQDNEGIEELRTAISQLLDWKELTTVSRPELWQRIRSKIEQYRKKGDVILEYTELKQCIQQDISNSSDSKEMESVVSDLVTQGVIVDTQRTDTGERWLVLQILEVERYSGSIIRKAANNPRRVPAIEREEIRSNDISFPGIKSTERLRRQEEKIVLDGVVELLIKNEICLEHEGLLIFPSLFELSENQNSDNIPHHIPLYYDFSGAIDNIFASLVTRLVYSERFGRMRLQENRVEFERSGEGTCGLQRVKRSGGSVHLDVYFEEKVQKTVRDSFITFIEDHLDRHGIELYEHLQMTCPCGFVFLEEIIRERIARGFNDIGCLRCDARNLISEGVQKIREQNPKLDNDLWGVKTKIEKKKKEATEKAKSDFQPNTEEIRILHLSDLHFTKETDPISMLQPLIADIQDSQGGLGFQQLDYLVISGDFTNFSTPGEFEPAIKFISGIINEFKLSSQRCIFVPGNHDLSWDEEVYDYKSPRQVDSSKLKPGMFFKEGKGYLIRNEDKYPDRFNNFSKHFYHPLIQQPYPLLFEEQSLSFLFTEPNIPEPNIPEPNIPEPNIPEPNIPEPDIPKTGIQFITLNSSWEIDEYFPNRSSIHQGALERGLKSADDEIKRAKDEERLSTDADILRIAVWHHPVTGNEKIENDAFLERLRQAGVKLCLHGHIHETREDIIGYQHPRKIYVAGGGSFGAPTKARPESTPRLYNLLEVERDFSRIRVHTRCKSKSTGAWGGWHVWPGDTQDQRCAYYDITL